MEPRLAHAEYPPFIFGNSALLKRQRRIEITVKRAARSGLGEPARNRVGDVFVGRTSFFPVAIPSWTHSRKWRCLCRPIASRPRKSWKRQLLYPPQSRHMRLVGVGIGGRVPGAPRFVDEKYQPLLPKGLIQIPLPSPCEP